MPTFHEILIKLRNDLGYRGASDEGVCVLYAEKAIDAFLVGEYKTVFKKRCEYIKSNYGQIPALLQRIKEETKAGLKANPAAFFQAESRGGGLSRTPPQKPITEETRQMIYEVAAFIEQGELYLNPDVYSGVFGQLLSQTHTQIISRYAQSDVLEGLGGRACLASFIGVYTQPELIQYMRQLNQLAKVCLHDFAVSLGSDNHRIGLCYSHLQEDR